VRLSVICKRTACDLERSPDRAHRLCLGEAGAARGQSWMQHCSAIEQWAPSPQAVRIAAGLLRVHGN